MLERLEIRNIALLEEARLDAADALTVFTGETGAGKSLLIHALDLLSGGRPNRDMIRHGADTALVEGFFSSCRDLLPPDLQLSLLREGLIEVAEGPAEEADDEAHVQLLAAFPDTLILSRDLKRSGRNYCRLNGRMISLQKLHEIASYLIDIQSQRDQALIYDEKYHIAFLDRFGGQELDECLERYSRIYQTVRNKSLRRRHLGGDPSARAREEDLLRYQLGEIDEIAPREDEDGKLRRHAERLRRQQRFSSDLQNNLYLLRGGENGEGGGLLSRFGELHHAYQEIAHLDERFKALADRAVAITEEAGELADETETALRSLESNPELLLKIEERLEKLAQVKRKYGPELTDVMAFRTRASERLAQFEAAEQELLQLDKELSALQDGLLSAANELSKAREAAARQLEQAVAAELRELGMPRVRFAVHCSELRRLGSGGRDEVRFLLQANPGEELKALSKIASGGESSRILLAIKSILAKGHPNATLVFDEVDAGISGEAAALVGEKLQTLSREGQLFCVTHSAQIAARADCHYAIRKEVRDGRTRTHLELLDKERRIDELARLLAGDAEDEQARRLAMEMLERAGQ